MRYPHYLVVLALVGLSATEAVETSDAELRVAELPAALLADCPTPAGIAGRSAECAMDFRTRWLARTPRGELFLVARRGCAHTCPASLVLRDRRGAVQALLSVAGELRFEDARDGFPVVRARREMSERYTSYERYEWRAGEYVRVEARLAYRIDGIECGDADACDAVAREALAAEQTERAVRIWERVHGVNWI